MLYNMLQYSEISIIFVSVLTIKDMKAKLVTISFIRRVVVEDNATEDEMILKAINKIRELDDIEMMENFEKVEDDIEYPFDPEIDNGGGYI